MRVITWNMNQRMDGWDWLRDQAPDIALLQEARLPDVERGNWRSIVHNVKHADWGTAVVSREIELVPHAPNTSTPYLAQLAGSVAVAQAPEWGMWFAAMHSHDKPVPNETLEGLDTDQVPRCQPGRTWEIDLIGYELPGVFDTGRFVAGGDLNSSLAMDDVGGAFGGNRELFDNLAGQGFVDCRPRFSPEEQQTWFRKGDRPYQLDHVFADAETEARVIRWDVIREPAETLRLSDHAPIVVEFDV